MTHAERHKTWLDRVAAFQASGESVAAWCREHEVKEHQLRYWLRKLAPIEPPQSELSSTHWLPIAVFGNEEHLNPEGQLVVRVGGATIEVQPGFNRALLVEVVQVLTGRC